MNTTRAVPEGLSENDLATLLGLLEKADSVELKLTVLEAARRSSITALEMDPLDAQIRQVYFFDTLDLSLNKHGLVARARRIQGGGDDAVVKLRPVAPGELPAELRRLPGFGIDLDDLTVLGPITVLKLKFAPPKYGRRMTAELWHYPDGSRILELSTKCAPTEAFDVAVKTKVYLKEHGIDVSGDQQTKTKTALTFFSDELRADDPVRP